jgi:dTMP kinase
MKNKNLFIAFEGIDGSGKSTQLRILTDVLEQTGHQVYPTFEPTRSPIGLLIRDIFNHVTEADHKTIAALFAADRLEHVLSKNDGLLQKMQDGLTVVTDRYYLSSYAYHSAHMPLQWVLDLNAPVVSLLKPDVHIFIDIPVETALERINAGRTKAELYETKENLQAVSDRYREVMAYLQDRECIRVVDGNRPQEQVAADIRDIIFELLKV